MSPQKCELFFQCEQREKGPYVFLWTVVQILRRQLGSDFEEWLSFSTDMLCVATSPPLVFGAATIAGKAALLVFCYSRLLLPMDKLHYERSYRERKATSLTADGTTARIFPDTGSAHSHGKIDKAKFKPLFLHARGAAPRKCRLCLHFVSSDLCRVTTDCVSKRIAHVQIYHNHCWGGGRKFQPP